MSASVMSMGKFLRLVWPSEGFYCITHPFKPKGSDTTVHMQKVFPTIAEAITYCHEQIDVTDTYFACLSLREEHVWDPTKDNFKTGTKGAYAVRTHANMLASKISFFDLDVGTDPKKYPTQRDALAGLLYFLEATGLPMPTLVSSGGGVHVYWHYDVAVPSEDWVHIAFQMKQLAHEVGLKIDDTRTTDVSSVLRVPETKNWKDRDHPRLVRVFQEGVVTPIETFKRIVSDALIARGVTPGTAPSKAAYVATADGFEAQSFTDFVPPPLDDVMEVCAQMREVAKAAHDPAHPNYRNLDNTAWYRGLVCTVGHTENGDEWARRFTDLFPRDNADVEAKIVQLKDFAPARCSTIRQFMPWGDKPCQSCKFLNDPQTPNPIAAARKGAVAPAPGLVSLAPPLPPQAGAGMSDGPSASPPPLPPGATTPPPIPLQLLSAQVMSIMIPAPPAPYGRAKQGGITLTRTDKDGNDTMTTIYGHDLFPLKRLINADGGGEQQVWRVTLPRSGVRDFTIDADVLYDARKFCTAIASNGIYPNKAEIPALQDYMVAYISQLQKDLDADAQLAHLGWTDGYRQFVLPDKTLWETGKVTATALTEGAKRATQHINKRGTLAAQVVLMDWYNDPGYLPHQFAILCSLASPIFYATGNHGIVVNMSGESGASKSTSLYTGASAWGDPILYPINGTNRGATANARSQRIATNANLPTGVDEITHLPAKEAIDLVMNITQPGHRLRLGQDGSEKGGSDNYKAAIMISTANSSLHALLSTDSAAGTAASMRVFEMKMTAPRVHTKAEADEFLRQIKENFGWLGEPFMHFVVTNRVAVERRVQAVMKDIDVAASIQSSERFWSAVIASVLVACEIANALGLLRYDTDALRRWAIDVQIPFMRGVVKEEYRDPLAVLTDYIAEKHGSIIVVGRDTQIGANTSGQQAAINQAYAVNNVHGALLGHYDQGSGVLYLLKQAFKDHCSRAGGSSARILDELGQLRGAGKVVVDRTVRRTLGAGTPLAKGQSWCFAVDMTHPDVAGHTPTLAAQGGVPTAPPAAPALRVVK